jgi:hypothetical protein
VILIPQAFVRQEFDEAGCKRDGAGTHRHQLAHDLGVAEAAKQLAYGGVDFALDERHAESRSTHGLRAPTADGVQYRLARQGGTRLDVMTARRRTEEVYRDS